MIKVYIFTVLSLKELIAYSPAADEAVDRYISQHGELPEGNDWEGAFYTLLFGGIIMLIVLYLANKQN